LATTLNASNSGSGGLVQTADASGVLALQTAGTTAVTIDASQNVGIGTTVIRTKFASVSGTDNTSAGSDPSGYAGSFIGTSGAANQSTLSVESNDTVAANTGGSIGLGGRYSSTSWAQWAKIAALKDNATVGDYGGSLAFYTRANGGSNTERMRIASNGAIYVNSTSDVGGNGPAFSVSASGNASFGNIMEARWTGTATIYHLLVRNGNGLIGGVSSSGSTTTYNTSSDYRLKDNIALMTGALAKVAMLKPVTYKWKVDGSDGEGFIAHELAEICSQAVVGDKDAIDENGNPVYQGIDTSFLVATLTAAIQEQQALITSLTARIAALEGTPA
jgi:hypothetical protein